MLREDLNNFVKKYKTNKDYTHKYKKKYYNIPIDKLRNLYQLITDEEIIEYAPEIGPLVLMINTKEEIEQISANIKIYFNNDDINLTYFLVETEYGYRIHYPYIICTKEYDKKNRVTQTIVNKNLSLYNVNNLKETVRREKKTYYVYNKMDIINLIEIVEHEDRKDLWEEIGKLLYYISITNKYDINVIGIFVNWIMLDNQKRSKILREIKMRKCKELWNKIQGSNNDAYYDLCMFINKK